MNESKFIQLTEYCLVEYVFANPAYNPYEIIQDEFVVLHNTKLNTRQLFNKPTISLNIDSYRTFITKTHI